MDELLAANRRVYLVSAAAAAPPQRRPAGRLARRDAFAQAVHDRSSQLFTVLGSAGVGKSRLAAEFLVRSLYARIRPGWHLLTSDIIFGHTRVRGRNRRWVVMSNSRRRRWTAGCGACLLVSLGASLVVSGASAAPRTTEPAALTQVAVKITDKAVIIARDKYTRGSTTRYPRGAIIDFVITNRGTRYYKAELLLIGKYAFSKYEQHIRSVKTPAAAAPGGTIHLKVNFYFRSKFELRALLSVSGKKHGAAAPIVVF
jgi:hypothetical protein